MSSKWGAVSNLFVQCAFFKEEQQSSFPLFTKESMNTGGKIVILIFFFWMSEDPSIYKPSYLTLVGGGQQYSGTKGIRSPPRIFFIFRAELSRSMPHHLCSELCLWALDANWLIVALASLTQEGNHYALGLWHLMYHFQVLNNIRTSHVTSGTFTKFSSLEGIMEFNE